MHIKTRNLKKMWGKEGYVLHHYGEFSIGSMLAELRIRVSRDDGKDIFFHQEWDTFKSLASRQDFYILPVKPSHDGVSELLLIRKDRIYPLFEQFGPVREALESSYWGIQGDEEIKDFVETTTLLRMALAKAYSEMSRLTTMPQTHYMIEVFSRQSTLEAWETYKELIKVWSKKISWCDKISNEIKNEVQRMAHLYEY